jgi:uroporphyrinogen decarboxylase
MESLTSRERVRLALQHQETDRIPIAMVCSGINPPADAAFDQLLRQTKGIDRETYLRKIIDVRAVEPRYVGPRLKAGEDIWGVRRKAQSFGDGSYDEIEYYPLADAATLDDVERHAWPSTDWFDYDALNESIAQAQADGEHCLMIHNGNIFETTWYQRGFEQTLMDLVLNPELVQAILAHVADFMTRHFTKMLEVAAGRIDLAFTADDIGGQNGLLMSLPTWEANIKPLHAKLNHAIHQFGVKVIYHTDGAVMQAVPGLIEMGIDVLQALQFSARGMDPHALKANYGRRLCFEGGVSVQTTLPFGSVEDVRRETRELISVLGANGGYILGPSHAIQAGTPPENILAMFETALTGALRGGGHSKE